MKPLLQKFKKHVIEASQNPNFIHHDWFVKYHLEIVEKIALELCDLYPSADRNIVFALVWIHDYTKILDKKREHDEALYERGREKMLEIGFEDDFVNTVIAYLSIFEQKMEIDLRETPIEVQIVSSADAASHLVGPFFAIYFKENSDKSLGELLADNKKKLKKDWERKMVLPEVKKAFEGRYQLMREWQGNFPDRYIIKYLDK